MKIKDQRTTLGKKADKMLIVGTLLSIVLPGTGIGTAVKAGGWAFALADVYYHPELYKKTFELTDTYRKLADLEEPGTVDVSVENLREYIDKVKKGMEEKEQENKKDESQ